MTKTTDTPTASIAAPPAVPKNGTTSEGSVRAWLLRASGPVLILALVLALEILGFKAREIPNLGALILTAVLYSTFVGGVAAGLVGGAIALGYYAYCESIPGNPFRYTPADLIRVLTTTGAVVLAVSLLGHLYRRLQRQLDQQRALRAEADEAHRKTTQTLDSITDGFFSVDREWRYTLVNRAAEQLCLEPVFEEAREALEALANRRSLHLDVEVEGTARAFIDRDRLLQALSNLVENAIKFTPAGGRVVVCARPAGPYVEVEVSDTGSGIPADQLPHIFDRFWQACRTDRRGAGLGLSIVKGIIEAHGGRVWAKSELGKGTSIYFTLPAQADLGRRRDAFDSNERDARQAAVAAAHRDHTGKVETIDDDPSLAVPGAALPTRSRTLHHVAAAR